MNKILVPISFSNTSKNALVHAYSIAKQFGATLSLLHCYPSEDYNREYKFENIDYDTGIRRMLISLYNECLENNDKNQFNLITYSGSLSYVISKITHQYDLLVMNRKTGFNTPSNRYFSDKLFYFSTKALCPVLITSTNQREFSFNKMDNIWHIQRNEAEEKIVFGELGKFGIAPERIVTKKLSQKSFISTLWKDIVTYTRTHDISLLKTLSQSFEEEKIGLLILVNRRKGMFEMFVKDEAFQIISQFDEPILIFQTKTNEE